MHCRSRARGGCGSSVSVIPFTSALVTGMIRGVAAAADEAPRDILVVASSVRKARRGSPACLVQCMSRNRYSSWPAARHRIVERYHASCSRRRVDASNTPPPSCPPRRRDARPRGLRAVRSTLGERRVFITDLGRPWLPARRLAIGLAASVISYLRGQTTRTATGLRGRHPVAESRVGVRLERQARVIPVAVVRVSSRSCLRSTLKGSISAPRAGRGHVPKDRATCLRARTVRSSP